MLTKVLLPDCRLGGDVGVPIRVNVGTRVITLRMRVMMSWSLILIAS